ncbi:MAG: laccase domain-containing protein, partial [Solirubrobacterales bacterium]
IGPGARSCCYEAGDEVHRGSSEQIVQIPQSTTSEAPSARSCWAAIQGRSAFRPLRALGASEVVDCGICTICSEEPRWHSHRRDGHEAGRSLALAWRS